MNVHRMPIQEMLLRGVVFAAALAVLTWLAVTSLP
jgi:hypothetical protein